MEGVVEVYADIPTSEVEVVARKGRVTGTQLVEVVNRTEDTEHTFRATLKSGPKPVK